MINVGERGSFVTREVKEKDLVGWAQSNSWKDRIDHSYFTQGTGESAE